MLAFSMERFAYIMKNKNQDFSCSFPMSVFQKDRVKSRLSSIKRSQIISMMSGTHIKLLRSLYAYSDPTRETSTWINHTANTYGEVTVIIIS